MLFILNVCCDISNTRKSVSSNVQTLRSWLKKRGTASDASDVQYQLSELKSSEKWVEATDVQTLRSWLKKRDAAEFFQPTSQCLDLSVWIKHENLEKFKAKVHQIL